MARQDGVDMGPGKITLLKDIGESVVINPPPVRWLVDEKTGAWVLQYLEFSTSDGKANYVKVPVELVKGEG